MKTKKIIIKKDGTKQDFDINKVVLAISKSAKRVRRTFSDEEIKNICKFINKETDKLKNIKIEDMHYIVEGALEKYVPEVAKSYKDYRNYKIEFADIMDKVYTENQRIMFRGDQENANADSALVSTKRALSYNVLNEELYKKFFLNVEEIQALNDGYIYIHDKSARRDTMNCCLFNMNEVLNNGFHLGNMYYNEPKTLDTAFDVMGDIILSAAGQQYGGFTIPQVDEILDKYAKKSYDIYYEEYRKIKGLLSGLHKVKAHKYAMNKIERDIEQGYQGWEYKFNTVASCRGDYPFITITLGHGDSDFSRLISKTIFRVHSEGQGKDGFKKPVMFPKIVMLYDKNIHGKGKKCRDVYDAGIDCSMKTMYPDWLSLTGEGYVSEIFKNTGKIISPMGCRAFLSPWYKEGGDVPKDENDEAVFIGRFNIGAISLHLPMILAKSREENKDFYEVLDYYLEMIRDIHKRTYEYLGNMRASCNPLGYCEGGFYGGNLNPQDKIKPLLKPMTASFGITALNELQQLYNGKSLVEDNEFSLEVMEYINNKINEFKKEDGWLYAIYGTPAESLVGKQVKQFRDKYGIVKNVSDKEYVSNSFHCHVTEDITPIQKQDKEKKFWNLFNGGKIQYVKYTKGYNRKAVTTLVDRAMEMGLYEGVNLDNTSYCQDCGYHGKIKLDEPCPKCGSMNVFSFDRMNGYLSVTRGNSGDGSSRLNKSKMEEIRDRKSM